MHRTSTRTSNRNSVPCSKKAFPPEYIDTLPKHVINGNVGKTVLCDTDRRDMFYCLGTLGKSRKYDGSSSTDPLHRKLHHLSFVNRKRTDVELAKSLRAKFEPGPVLILGN
ncbi:hypothetical protein BX661DRAFT_170264 [Kickxella alabastrina]|uniref:uncharacterized protein n=1 Tax=Kickxella alabastrina TaxID=61397 RepID=UPI00221FE7DE|nr:uncharacterized protein BX661DRAFT_170264 [Kickxella alabastrina]KAI7829897.1 hypothetical protein BX661DRAFT_170264 [Kickxella alabastrina]